MSSGFFWRRKQSWQRWLAILWLLTLSAAAILAGWLPADSLTPDLLNSNAPPFVAGHWLGTDPLGQDVWATLVYGARTALLVSLPATALTAGLGTGLGLMAGYWQNTHLRFALVHWLAVGSAIIAYGLLTPTVVGVAAGWWPLALGAAVVVMSNVLPPHRWLRRAVAIPVDQLLLAAIVLLAALPRLLLVLSVAAAFEPTLTSLVLLLTLTSWTQSARLVRAEVRRVRQLPYLEAAYAAGLPPWRIVCHHVLPNVWRPVLTTLPLSVAGLIALETTLSFLGIGLPPEIPSWGRLLALSRLAPSSWWLLLFPALCLLATTLALRQVLPSDEHQGSS